MSAEMQSSILYNFTKREGEKVVLQPGKYRIECWGAQGFTYNELNNNIGGNGAYTSGIINFKEKIVIYLYIGEQGHEYDYIPFNGGGIGQFNGGGATDVRLSPGPWDDLESLKSRIMVAAGGAGPDTYDPGGAGGELSGIASKQGHGQGGTQTSGGSGYVSGSFGKGGGVDSIDGCGGGGGGYYGGGSGTQFNNYGGGGGSSFISGHLGCNAIAESYTLENPEHTDSPIHYSGYSFTSTSMINGNNLKP